MLFQVGQLGLTRQYEVDPHHRTVISRTLALPLVPAEEIPEVFGAIQEYSQGERLQELLEYVETTWILHPVWKPENWSGYGQPVRTNNDVEGWHYRFNRKVIISFV